MPVTHGGEHLLAYFFEMGPTTADGSLGMAEVQAWAGPLTGRDEWEPWQARLFVRLSRVYSAEQHRARSPDALPSWPYAVKMWRWVQNQMAERSFDRLERDIEHRAKNGRE